MPVSILSAEEETFLSSFVVSDALSGQLWVGARYKDEVLTWMDGSDASYNIFPETLPLKGNCVVYYNPESAWSRAGQFALQDCRRQM